MARSKPKRKNKTVQSNRFNLQKAVLANKQRIIELCEGVGCNITDKLTYDDYIQIYISTIQHGDVKCHPEYDIPSNIVMTMKKTVKTTLYTKQHTPIKPANIKINLIDFYHIEGLMTYIERYFKTDESTKKEIEKDIEYLKAYYGNREQQHWIVEFWICNLLKTVTVPSRHIYTLHYKVASKVNYKKCQCSSFYYLKRHPPIKKHININNHWRPIYKIQHPEIDTNSEDVVIKDYEINTNLLKKAYSGSKDKLPVYIQSHALDRICERLYPLNLIFINQLIHICLSKDIKLRYYNSRILIEVKADLGKLGYFVAEIIDEKIVLKTFLLLSNNSTPEGTTFNQLTGFNKYDVDYWDLNCLPTFINNNMDKNNHLYTLFEQAGLLHLFKLNPDMITENSPDYDFSGELNWDKLEDYINNTVDKQELSDEEFDCIDFDAMLR